MTTTITNGSSLCGTIGSISWPTPEKKMKQVKVAIFFVTRDEDYDIIDSTFDQEVWVCQKKGVSLEAATMKQLGYVIDPDVKIIREVLSITI
jgi:hypothetical protein